MLYEDLIIKMSEFNNNDPKRIQHFIKVYQFARLIGIRENIDKEKLHILSIASIMHDIGIRPSEQKYGRCDGKLQEKEGPYYAEVMLKEFPEVTEKEKDRVLFLIGHHHTYDQVDDTDYLILLEADFLVNALEDSFTKEGIIRFRDNVFKTRTGIHLLNVMYGL